MTGKIRLGITRDFFDANGEFIVPAPGLSLIDEIPGVTATMLPEFLKTVTPDQIQGYDMIASFRPLWTKASVDDNHRLLSIHRFGVGFERLDVPALTRAGIMLFLTPAAVRRPMAVVYLTLLLALSTRLLVKDRLIRAGRWDQHYHYPGQGLVGRTLGAVGVGNIGHEVFKLAAPLDMRHIACDPHVTADAVADVGVELVDLPTVLAQSDYLMVLCPLNARTQGLIGEKELQAMKQTAFLINAARGPIVDERALVTVLQEGWIRGAGLDVFAQEPIAPDNPLLTMDNVVLSPHALGDTDQALCNMWESITEQIAGILRGEIPESLLNRDVVQRPEFKRRLNRFRAARA